MMINGHSVYCDCCGSQKMAEIVGDNLVIKDRRHGEKHVVVLKLADILDILEVKANNNSKDAAVLVAANH